LSLLVLHFLNEWATVVQYYSLENHEIHTAASPGLTIYACEVFELSSASLRPFSSRFYNANMSSEQQFVVWFPTRQSKKRNCRKFEAPQLFALFHAPTIISAGWASMQDVGVMLQGRVITAMCPGSIFLGLCLDEGL
jgi:hypothetical protein